ncbi:hypothetical protein J6500_22160 [Bradyrhizobium sp. WSM 1704]|uniref:hypothetical protein n=1 Tax=Bradyrhizobium semiaridum TaxID=2821404 RepID=UPI001CE33499|nr:hypothetical protein [Bradyrhizobium semiaridum]MCA6124576.1 hypothetical protein [Bradyrhizobium semiaridum]
MTFGPFSSQSRARDSATFHFVSEMLEFLTKHFIVLSTLVIGGASAVAMLFLAAYLAVFDWNLIWLVEYTDIAKLFLIGTALLSSAIATALNYAWDLLAWLKHQMKVYKWGLFVGIALVIGAGVYSIHNDVKTGNGYAAYHVFRMLSTIGVVSLLYLLFREAEQLKQLNWLSILNVASSTVFALGIFGATYGYYVRDVSKNVMQITTKSETFENAKVIMFLSHHLAFLVEKRVVVIPTADLIKVLAQVNSEL